MQKARTRAGVVGPAILVSACLLALACAPSPPRPVGDARPDDAGSAPLSPGPRALYLLDRLAPGPLRDRLDACRDRPIHPSRFTIGHRGAPLFFPEHTRESYLAAARLGAGALECDVTFTRDRVLVCRHAQCDLATSTNILETPLADRCREPFRAARFDETTGELVSPASARCCTSELDADEFLSLEGRMDAADPRATTIAEFVDATPAWRTDLHANRGTLMTHAESVALFRTLGVEMVPELKAPEVEMPFGGDFDRDDYAQAIVETYREAGVPAADVSLQSFDATDLDRWRRIAPDFAERAIWLDGRDPRQGIPTVGEFEALRARGIRTVAPPIPVLLELDSAGRIVASDYARRARAAGLEIVTWTLERSGRIRDGHVEGRPFDFYLGPLLPALGNDGDLYRVLEALHREVGVRAVFTDWPEAVAYYASCHELL